jgi:autotransporter adhesin
VVNPTATNSIALGSGSIASRPNSVDFGQRIVGGVADGELPTDVVNKRQLDSSVSESRRGVASASALAMIPSLNQNDIAGIGVAIAGYKGKQAIAVGATANVHSNLVIKIGAGISGNDATYGIGGLLRW